MLNGIEEIDILQEQYRQAIEYMDGTGSNQPGCSFQTRPGTSLRLFYGNEKNYGCNAAYYVADYLDIEPSTAYKRKSRALERLTVLLFGNG